jgi:hypothetical protein
MMLVTTTSFAGDQTNNYSKQQTGEKDGEKAPSSRKTRDCI